MRGDERPLADMMFFNIIATWELLLGCADRPADDPMHQEGKCSNGESTSLKWAIIMVRSTYKRGTPTKKY